MTKVLIDPGPCNFKAVITADSDDGQEVTLKVGCGCEAVQGMMKELGNEFDAFALCLTKPGTGPLYEYASEHFPVHAGCPILSGITKCVEAECGLALKKDVSIQFAE